MSIGKAEIAYELGELTVNGNSINLYQYPDTISVGHNSSWEEIFRTEPFTVSGQTSLSFLQAFEILNRDSLMNTFPNKAKIEFRLEVVDAQSGQVLASPNVHVVTRNLPPDSRQVKNLVFNIPGSWNVYLRVGLRLPANLDIGQSMVEAYYIEDGGGRQGYLAKNAGAPGVTPTRFELFQNYPNPFNPETIIRFALPQQANVKLTIYDVSGRQVRVLLKKQMSAGYHTATWDGRNDNGVQVGTGVYFYHITAGDFSQVRKMLLVR
ncbi:MAG: T9SS type A sorting domain-containing protein [Calditrichia bacterium]